MAYINKTGTTKEDGRYVHRFSQTFLNGLQTCPEQARAKYRREIPDDGHTASTARGVAMHAGIEYLLWEKYNDDLGPHSGEEAVSIAYHELDTIGEWQHTKMSRAKVYSSTVDLLIAFRKHVLADVEPAALEKRFDVPFYSDDKREIRLVGAIDCIDENGEVWDWKSATRPYEPWEKQRWAIQPTVYTHAVHAMKVTPQGPLPETLFHYAIMFDNHSAQLLDVSRDESHVDWLRQQALQAAIMLESGIKPWPLNDGGFWCSEKWCPKFFECKGAVMLDSWQKVPK